MADGVVHDGVVIGAELAQPRVVERVGGDVVAPWVRRPLVRLVVERLLVDDRERDNWMATYTTTIYTPPARAEWLEVLE